MRQRVREDVEYQREAHRLTSENENYIVMSIISILIFLWRDSVFFTSLLWRRIHFIIIYINFVFLYVLDATSS